MALFAQINLEALTTPEMLAPMLGLLIALVTGIAGYFLLSRRSPEVAAASSEAKGARVVDAETPLSDHDPFLDGSPNERRLSLRRRGKEVKIYIADDSGADNLRIGWVVDRSLGGLGLATDVRVQVGSIISVRPLLAEPSIPWVQLTVKSCRQRDTHWSLGCQYHRPPPWDVQLLFN